MDGRYVKAGRSQDYLDFALVRLQRNAKNQVLATAVGDGNRLKLIGCPGGSHKPRDCKATTRKFNSRFVQIDQDRLRTGRCVRAPP
ncbi:hypothetical protein AV521_32290 [Streptomyces sp. IMTB 2501]|uniref:hypothetical protein n=1 Tax=Streptomyces sp. IMTB 2501 TaxID=1776340 RepID=UPI00096D1066|nr:hypothetical protein [Streptomyces sp. IMTB 2501]OLZ65362.1 hypothetical protein AV521_32290 [Streptomyces sp. IMTB 2501]